MAVDGIGNKIMLHRATEYARDVSHQQRQAELMQENAHRQVQRQAEEQAMVVDDVYEAAQTRIRREKEKQEKHARQQQQPKAASGSAKAREGDALPKAASLRKKIDIRI